MAVTYNNVAKAVRMNATRSHFAGGTMEIRNSSDNVLVTFTLDGNAGSVNNAVWTLTFDDSTVAASSAGTADKAVIKTSGGDADLTGLTVGTSGTDIILDNTNIASGQNVTITSATITHAA